MSDIPRLEDLELRLGGLSGKRIFVRTDFNVPLVFVDDGTVVITDDFRIRAALPTIEWLTERGANVVCASHLGRPFADGWTEPNPKYSMGPVQARLAELAPDVELLENLRFDAGETGNSDEFVAQLIAGSDGKSIDGYVNDAFEIGRAHV